MRALSVHATKTVMVGDNVADAGAVLVGTRGISVTAVAVHAERGLKEILAICTP
jgi:hypothetical protein